MLWAAPGSAPVLTTPMSPTRSFRTLTLAALAFAPSLVACSSPPGLRPPSATDGVVFEGGASKTQLSVFLEREPEDWAWAGGRFDTPDTYATLEASTPQTFSWHADPADFTEAEAPDDVVMTHLLVFSTSESDAVLRVFTALPEYTPDTAAWQGLVAIHEPITVSLTTASFVASDLPEDGGPFIGQALTFTIE